jgi:hypothetical protein
MATIQVKTRSIILAILVTLAGTFLLGGYLGHRRSDRASKSVIWALKGQIEYYKYQVGELQKTATQKDQFILSQKEAIKQGLIDKEELKKLHLKAVSEVTSLKGQVKILKDSLSHNGNIIITQPCDSFGTAASVIELPFSFSKPDSKYYYLAGNFDTEGNMTLDSLNVPFGVDVWTGIDKQTKRYKAVVTTDNPYVTISEIKSVKMDLPKPKRFRIGAQAGYGIILGNPVRTAPYIGFGISYNP